MKLDMGCTRCHLARNRRQIVPPDGNPESRVCLLGEAPGETEDMLGRPFVGRAGRMLDTLMAKAGLSRQKVFITNVVKCRPPANRRPKSDEMEACFVYLAEELEGKELVVALGRTACLDLLGREVRLIEEANRLYETDVLGRKILILPTYHPAACLFNKEARDVLYRSLRFVRDYLEGKVNTQH